MDTKIQMFPWDCLFKIICYRSLVCSSTSLCRAFSGAFSSWLFSECSRTPWPRHFPTISTKGSCHCILRSSAILVPNAPQRTLPMNRSSSMSAAVLCRLNPRKAASRNECRIRSWRMTAIEFTPNQWRWLSLPSLRSRPPCNRMAWSLTLTFEPFQIKFYPCYQSFAVPFSPYFSIFLSKFLLNVLRSLQNIIKSKQVH